LVSKVKFFMSCCSLKKRTKLERRLLTAVVVLLTLLFIFLLLIIILACRSKPLAGESMRRTTSFIYGSSYLIYIHSFSSLSYDRSKASSKASSPHTAIQSFLLQMRVSSPFLKVIQQLRTSSSLSSCHFYPLFYLSFNNQL
jgi:hypothetical protein